jgi:hypothetical protein
MGHYQQPHPAGGRREHRLVQVSASTAMTDLARELIDAGQPVINLSSGEPDFPTPRHVIDAAYQAALGGDTKYTAQNGTPALKRAVQRKFKRENRLDYTLDEIIVGNGGRQVNFNATMTPPVGLGQPVPGEPQLKSGNRPLATTCVLQSGPIPSGNPVFLRSNTI